MLPLSEKIMRLRKYGERLDSVVDQVNHELLENRQRRDDWLNYNNNWKNHWLDSKKSNRDQGSTSS